jgi:purine-nucleoside phosphorylase
VSVPSVAGKHGFESVYRARDFVAHLRQNGWDPGVVPDGVIFTYGGFDLVCASQPAAYTMNPMLGPGPGRFFSANASGGRVGICCMGIGAPAVVSMFEVFAALGVSRFLSLGTAGALAADLVPGDIVVLTGAVRDEGTSYHYVAPEVAVSPDAELTAALGRALDATTPVRRGPTWTTDAPYRQSAEEIAEYRRGGVLTVEMEAAALFAAAMARDRALASAVVIDGVYPEPIGPPAMDTATAFGALYDLVMLGIDVLTP